MLTAQDKAYLDAQKAKGLPFDQAWGKLQSIKTKLGQTSAQSAPQQVQDPFNPLVKNQTPVAAGQPVATPEDQWKNESFIQKAGDVFTGKKNIYGEDVAAEHTALDQANPIGAGITKGLVGGISELSSLGEKGLQLLTGVNKGQETAGEKVASSEPLQTHSLPEAAIKGITQVLAPILATGGVSGLMTDTGTALSTKALTALGASEKTAQALAPIGGALAASPFQTAVATGASKGELPTKGELAAGGVLDSIFPALKAIKGLRSPTLTETIEKGIAKGIKPSTAGKSTTGDYQEYLHKAEDAVKTIVANRNDLQLADSAGEMLPEGSLPQNLQQFGDSIAQTKQKVFDAYDALAKQAGESGLVLNPSETNIVPELQKIVDNKGLQTVNPKMVEHAQDLIDRYSNASGWTPKETQDAIASLNEELKAFYQNPSSGAVGVAKLDALAANHLREMLDKSIEGSTGVQYQELKDAYGSLKTIEKDVMKRALLDARKNNKGLIDFFDIFSAGDILSGLATGSPAGIAKGVGMKAFQSWFKHLNDPNTIVKSMFKSASDLMPEMKIGGGGIEEVVKGIEKQLPQTMSASQVANLLVQVLKGALNK